MISTIMMFWVSILDFPQGVELTTTPCAAATERIPVMRNSRAAMTTTTHDGSSDCPARITSTVITSSLSARGSRNLPSSVTRLRLRAIRPSSVSVAAAVT